MNHESVWNIETVTHDEKPSNPTGCDGGGLMHVRRKFMGLYKMNGSPGSREARTVLIRAMYGLERKPLP